MGKINHIQSEPSPAKFKHPLSAPSHSERGYSNRYQRLLRHPDSKPMPHVKMCIVRGVLVRLRRSERRQHPFAPPPSILMKWGQGDPSKGSQQPGQFRGQVRSQIKIRSEACKLPHRPSKTRGKHCTCRSHLSYCTGRLHPLPSTTSAVHRRRRRCSALLGVVRLPRPYLLKSPKSGPDRSRIAIGSGLRNGQWRQIFCSPPNWLHRSTNATSQRIHLCFRLPNGCGSESG